MNIIFGITDFSVHKGLKGSWRVSSRNNVRESVRQMESSIWEAG